MMGIMYFHPSVLKLRLRNYMTNSN